MLADVENLASILNMPPEVAAGALTIYRKATKAHLFRRRRAEVIAGVVTYAACRTNAYPCSACEVARPNHLDPAQIAKLADALARKLNLELLPEDPASYIPRFCAELQLPRRVEERARVVLTKAVEYGITIGKPAHAVAAGVLYFATKHEQSGRTQKEIAEVTCVAASSLREYYATLLREIPPGLWAVTAPKIYHRTPEE